MPKDPNFGGGRAGISTSIEQAAGREIQTHTKCRRTRSADAKQPDDGGRKEGDKAA